MGVARRALIRGALALVALGALSGCGLLVGEQVQPVESPVTCLDLPAGVCERVIGEVGRQAVEHRAVLVEVRMRCTATDGCTESGGSLEYEARLSNGMTIGSSGYGWGSAVGEPGAVPGVKPGVAPGGPVVAPEDAGGGPAGVPVPDVEPICLGIDRASCRNLARDFLSGEAPGAGVVSIVVTCSGRCTPTGGEGTTRVTFVDGSTADGSWGYEGPLAP